MEVKEGEEADNDKVLDFSDATATLDERDDIAFGVGVVDVDNEEEEEGEKLNEDSLSLSWPIGVFIYSKASAKSYEEEVQDPWFERKAYTANRFPGMKENNSGIRLTIK